MSRKTGLSTSPGAMRINNSLAAGGAAEKAAVIFRKHDLNQVGGKILGSWGEDLQTRGRENVLLMTCVGQPPEQGRDAC